MGRTVELSIETDETRYRVGDEIPVRVTDGYGTPVEDAEVRASTGAVNVTDTTGTTVVTIDQRGAVRLVARKVDSETVTYVPDSVAVAVVAP